MNPDKFRSAKLRRPVKEFRAPALAGVLFDDEEEPVMYLKGLSANEMLTAREARQTNSVRNALAKAIAEGEESAMQQAFKRLMGNGVEDKITAAETAFRIEVIVGGVTDQDGTKRIFDHELAVKLAEYYPTLFLEVSTEILALTGEGASMGEPQRNYTETQRSKTP